MMSSIPMCPGAARLRAPASAGVGIGVILCALTAAADTVHLSNGRSIDGLIVREDAESIVLDIGAGTTTIRRGRIRSILRSDAAGAAAMQEKWRQRYLTSDRYVPPRFKELAAAFDRLENARASAFASRRDVAQRKREDRVLLARHEALRQGVEDISEALHAAAVGRRASREDAMAFNALVASNALMVSRMERVATEISRGRAAEDDACLATPRFFGELDSFRQQLKTVPGASPELSESEASFLAEVSRRAEAYGREFREFVVPTSRGKEGVVVTAQINGSIPARLVVDTGAGVVAISRNLARKLDIRPASTGLVEVVVADGRKVAVTPVVIASIQVGDARVEDCPAVVLPDEPAPGVDGLLGMTFLREFSFLLDPAGRGLVLKQLQSAPNEP